MKIKQSFFLSFGSGILLSLPWLLQDWSWTLLFAFVPLLLAGDLAAKSKNQPYGIFFFPGFITFLTWNFISTWWIAYVSVGGMLIIVLLNALLMAAVWGSRQWVRRKLGEAPAFFSLLVFWLTFEFLHHNWTIQWPWLTLGNGFANSVKIIQWYEFTGVLGGSLWVLISNILIFLLVQGILERSFLKALRLAAYASFVVFGPICWSVFRYADYRESGAVQNIVVLQPNIEPYTEKFSGMSANEQISRIVSMVKTNLSDSTDLIVAPETAWPPLWEDSVWVQNHSLLPVSEAINNHPHVRFITGAITRRKSVAGEKISETARMSADGSFYYDVFNSALMVDQTPEVQISHKNILVSGVEKMPFQKYFSFLDNYALHLGGTSGSLSSSAVPVLFSGKDGEKIGLVICFESVFGEYLGNQVKNGANLLVVLTNDGWWKDSPGTAQHFSYSRLRAVEMRRSIVRSANTGISGFINQRGDVVNSTETNKCEAIGAPVTMNEVITVYARYGDFLGRISFVLAGLTAVYLLLFCWWRKVKKNPH